MKINQLTEKIIEQQKKQTEARAENLFLKRLREQTKTGAEKLKRRIRENRK